MIRTVIRTRIPKLDDEKIYSLVVTQLVPYAQKSQPFIEAKRRSIIRRLNNSIVLVSSAGRQPPFGFINFKVVGDLLTIDMLAVDGRKQSMGLGRELMDAAERYGRRLGARRAQLGVDEPNTRAQKFYFRQGYGISDYFPSEKLFVLTKRLDTMDKLYANPAQSYFPGKHFG